MQSIMSKKHLRLTKTALQHAIDYYGYAMAFEAAEACIDKDEKYICVNAMAHLVLALSQQKTTFPLIRKDISVPVYVLVTQFLCESFDFDLEILLYL